MDRSLGTLDRVPFVPLEHLKQRNACPIGREVPETVARGIYIKPRKFTAPAFYRVEGDEDELLPIRTPLSKRAQGCRGLAATLTVVIELAEKIKKGQYKTGKLGSRKATMSELWNAALAA